MVDPRKNSQYNEVVQASDKDASRTPPCKVGDLEVSSKLAVPRKREASWMIFSEHVQLGGDLGPGTEYTAGIIYSILYVDTWDKLKDVAREKDVLATLLSLLPQ